MHTPFYDTEDVAKALQNWLICVEMFIASLAHRYAFSHTEFIDGQDGSMCRFLLAFFDSTIPVDFLLELGTFPIFYRRAQMVNADGYTSVSTDDYDTDDAGSNDAEGQDSSEDENVTEELVFGQKYDDFSSKAWSLKV